MTGPSSSSQVTSKKTMLVPAAFAARVSFVVSFSVPTSGATGLWRMQSSPSRLRKATSPSVSLKKLRYEANHPQGWRRASTRTAKGMCPWPSSKYQAEGSTSSVETSVPPSAAEPGATSTSTMLLMKWYGGPGSRGHFSAPSYLVNIFPKASLGLPQAHDRRAS